MHALIGHPRLLVSERIRSVLAAPVVSGEGVVKVINNRNGAHYATRAQRRLALVCHFDGKLLTEIANRSRSSA